MKKATTPLTKAEIAMGLKRLGSSALIRESQSKPAPVSRRRPYTSGYYEHAANLTGTYRCADVDRAFSALAERCELGKQLTSVIFDLAVALVTSRLTESEVFRLGTSEEAMRLFESDCHEWNDQRLRAHNAAVSA